MTTAMYVGLALSAASTAAQMEAQRKNASQQGESIRQANAMKQAELERAQDQQYEAAAAAANEAARAAQKDAAAFDVIAGEAGGGNTVDRARSIGELQASENLATIDKNAELQASETGFASIAANRNALSQIGAIQKPNYLGAALKLGSDGLNAYTANEARKGK